ncbi:MAG TPA: LlaMI family restriction endonuclease [Candidatus Paceibacterota bacterium]|nr:LlaMI family restriction endonuclease [Candidatus Paceibacterota bacterium]
MKHNISPHEVSQIKQRIITRFIKNVKGKKSNTKGSNIRHDGKDGHWLEKQMGVKHNASNKPDIDGFEMKNNTTSKTTFGDWSADYYIFSKDSSYGITRSEFLKLFGKPNLQKKGRLSWSGEPCPKIGPYNSFGQKLTIDSGGNTSALYSFKADKRTNKHKLIPKKMQRGVIVLAKWNAQSMKRKLEEKFNQLGWFKCVKNKEGVYTQIVFGDPYNFKKWIKAVQRGVVFFDSGMYETNKRPYSQWRASNAYWDSLITSKY